MASKLKNRIMGIHSKFLVHWTGKKDIEKFPNNIKAQKYVDRLKDYYQNGLFLRRTTEASIRKLKIKNLLRICFTEIRLSQAQTHADRYGKLGIGFTRDFIMNKGGRPVIYIPFKADICLLEDSIRNVYEKTRGDAAIQRSINWLFAYVKRMSDKNGDENYEEMEWRLVYDENPNNKDFTEGKEEGTFRFKFVANDVKVIVFPDEETKQLSFNDTSIERFFSLHRPIMATLEECSNF
jgi:hypothetical protein